MDFKQLESFVAVVHSGSFSRAAKLLYLTQPTVSAHIQSLEKELQTQLLARTTREVYTTEAGRTFYTYAKDLLDLRRRALAALPGAKGSGTGLIRLAASSIPGNCILPRLLPLFRKKHPEIRFELALADSAQVVEQVENGLADMGLLGTRPPHSSCVFEPFTSDQLVIVTPAEDRYRQLGWEGFTAQTLLSHPFIAREPGSGTRAELENYLTLHGCDPARLNIIAQINDTGAILESVMNGLGIAVVSLRAAEAPKLADRICIFPFREDKLLRSLYFVYREGQSPRSELTLFTQFTTRFFSEEEESVT